MFSSRDSLSRVLMNASENAVCDHVVTKNSKMMNLLMSILICLLFLLALVDLKTCHNPKTNADMISNPIAIVSNMSIV